VADPLSHATQGAVVILAPFITRLRKKTHLWLLAVLGGCFGALPDLFWFVGYLLRDGGALYASAHHGRLQDVFQYVPMYALHLAVDSLTHNPDRTWYGWNVRIWLQLLLWLVNGLAVYLMFRVWQSRSRIRH
jgi:hypothetical protein